MPSQMHGWGIMIVDSVIVSRHAGMIEWLRRQGIKAEVLSHVEHPIQIWNRVVYGNIPYHLAAEARIVITVDMPKLRVDQRGKELSPEEMDEAGATLVAYRVLKRRVITECINDSACVFISDVPCGGDE